MKGSTNDYLTRQTQKNWLLPSHCLYHFACDLFGQPTLAEVHDIDICRSFCNCYLFQLPFMLCLPVLAMPTNKGIDGFSQLQTNASECCD